MEQGMLFDIAHSSFVDGPGIRTTVFFKGCNLQCAWCHNPESQYGLPEMLYHRNKCTGCGACREVCREESCILCGECTKVCPVSARKICGRQYTVEEVLAEIRKDTLFYEMSGGGVTFSGGECMLQVGFLKELLKKCREEGIHTAVDTAGHVPWASFEEILPYTDLFLYDIKCLTERLHRNGTGVSNQRILGNLERLSMCFHGEILVRIPIIPGFNTDPEELRSMAEFLDTINCRVEPLPYHRLGEHKYAAVGRKMTNYSVPSREDMEKINDLFKKGNVL